MKCNDRCWVQAARSQSLFHSIPTCHPRLTCPTCAVFLYPVSCSFHRKEELGRDRTRHLCREYGIAEVARLRVRRLWEGLLSDEVSRTELRRTLRFQTDVLFRASAATSSTAANATLPCRSTWRQDEKLVDVPIIGRKWSWGLVV